jgi:hypothetical protein
MQVSSVSASFKQGMTTDTSTVVGSLSSIGEFFISALDVTVTAVVLGGDSDPNFARSHVPRSASCATGQ